MVHETYSSLIADIKNVLEDVSENGVSTQMEEELKRSTDEHFYGSTHVQHSAHYLTQSVDSQFKTEGDEMELSVFHNPQKMQLNYPSWIDGASDDNRQNIILWLNEGTSGSPIYNHPAYRFIDHAHSTIGGKLRYWYVVELRKRGVLLL